MYTLYTKIFFIILKDPAVMSLGEILAIWTGLNTIPSLGYDQSFISIEFLHYEQSNFPKANTCALVLYLPIHNNYEDFKNFMNYGIPNGMVFGSA